MRQQQHLAAAAGNNSSSSSRTAMTLVYMCTCRAVMDIAAVLARQQQQLLHVGHGGVCANVLVACVC